jgi:predicted nucleic acid-binding protein
MISWIYFDTNFFYRLANNEFTGSCLNKFKEFVNAHNIKLYYTPITFVEVSKHINKNKIKHYAYYKNIISKIRDWCGDNIREYPDQVLAKSLDLEARKTNDVKDFNRFRDLILNHKSYGSLHEEENFNICWKLITIILEAKDKWCKSMKEFILTINPTYNKRKNKGKIPRVTDKEVRETLLNELETDDFKIKCIDATLYKATDLNDQSFIGKANFNQSMENIYRKFSAFLPHTNH